MKEIKKTFMLAGINSSLIDGFQYVSFTSITNTNKCGWRSSGYVVVLVREKALYRTAIFPAFHLLFPSSALCNAVRISSFSPLIESRLCRFHSTFPLSVPMLMLFLLLMLKIFSHKQKLRKSLRVPFT